MSVRPGPRGIEPAARFGLQWGMAILTDVPCLFTAFQAAPAGENYEMEFLQLTASVAEFSGDPFLKAVAAVAHRNHLPFLPVIGYQSFEGLGWGGAVEKGQGLYRALVMGNHEFMRQCGLSSPETLETACRRWEAEGALVVRGGWDGWVRGLLKFAPEK